MEQLRQKLIRTVARKGLRFVGAVHEDSPGVKPAPAPLQADDALTLETGQHAQKLEKQVTITLDYLLYLPPQYDKDTKKTWPLILFLHGSGERGSDVQKVKVHGPPKIVESTPDSILAREFIVVSPQCPAGRGWKADNLIVRNAEIRQTP